MAPAEAREVGEHRLGEVAEVAPGEDARRAVALGELLPVGPVDHGDVGEQRRLLPHEAVEVDLLRRVGHVVVAADDVGDAHLHVVHDDAEVVDGGPVGAQDDEVVELPVARRDGAEDTIVEGDLPVRGEAGAEHVGHSRGDLPVPAGALVPVGALLRLGQFAARVELLHGADAPVGAAGGEQLLGLRAVERLAIALVEGPLVGVDAEPPETAEDPPDRLLLVALLVGVLDAEDVGPPLGAGIEVVEQRRPGAADVEVPRGGRCEADAYAHGGRLRGRGVGGGIGDVPY